MSDARRPWLWRTLLAAGALFLLAVGWQAWRLEDIAAQGRRDLAAVLAEIEAGDPRWRWDDLEGGRPEVPDAENSWCVLAELEARHRASPLPRPGARRVFPAVPRARANRLLPAAELDERLASAAERADVLAAARSLKDFPHGRLHLSLGLDPVRDNLGHIDRCRNAVRYLELDQECRLHAGRTAEAVACVHAALHAGAALRGEPRATPQLARLEIQSTAVRRLERLLGMGEPSEGDLAALLAHFEAEAAEPVAETALRGEAAAGHELYENLHAGRLPLGDYVERWRSGWYDGDCPAALVRLHTTGIVYHSYLAEDHAAFLRHWSETLAVARLSVAEQYPAWLALEERQRARWPGPRRDAERCVLARALCNGPHLGKVALHAQAWLVCGRAALAAERFRRAAGRWPSSWGELVPAYLPAVLLDPYTARPLRLRAMPDGLAVYSTNHDGIDHGGEDLAGSREEAGQDLGMRLWDSPERRLLPVGEVAHNAGDPVGPLLPIP